MPWTSEAPPTKNRAWTQPDTSDLRPAHRQFPKFPEGPGLTYILLKGLPALSSTTGQVWLIQVHFDLRTLQTAAAVPIDGGWGEQQVWSISIEPNRIQDDTGHFTCLQALNCTKGCHIGSGTTAHLCFSHTCPVAISWGDGWGSGWSQQTALKGLPHGSGSMWAPGKLKPRMLQAPEACSGTSWICCDTFYGTCSFISCQRLWVHVSRIRGAQASGYRDAQATPEPHIDRTSNAAHVVAPSLKPQTLPNERPTALVPVWIRLRSQAPDA